MDTGDFMTNGNRSLSILGLTAAYRPSRFRESDRSEFRKFRTEETMAVPKVYRPTLAPAIIDSRVRAGRIQRRGDLVSTGAPPS